jgi:DNA-binding transcriptional LysR family regulator
MDWADRIGRRIKLRDLHILLAIDQHGSMARAADSLAISQPVVSKVIADLEHAVGVRLLDRDRHGAEPTVYGRALLNRGLAAFDELRQGVKDIEFLQKPTAGELRIGATEPISAGFLPAIVDKLSRQYPLIFFHVTQVLTNLNRYRPLLERDVEILIGRVPHGETGDEVNVETLFDEPILVAAGLQSRWVRRRRIDLAELVDEPWILPLRDNLVGQLVAELFHARGLPLPRNGATGGLQMNDSLLATGRYLGVYSRSVLRLKAKRWQIKVLPVDLPPQRSAVGIMTLKRRTVSPLARLFIDCARNVTKSLALDAPVTRRSRRYD